MYIILTKDLHPTITTSSGLSLSCNHTNTDVRMWWASMWASFFREYAEKYDLSIDISRHHVRLGDPQGHISKKAMQEFDELLKSTIKSDCQYGDFY